MIKSYIMSTFNLTVTCTTDIEKKYFEIIKQFIESDKNTLTLSSVLSTKDRLLIHKLCEQIGIVSESIGENPHRFIKIKKVQLSENKKIYDKLSIKQFIKDFHLPIIITNNIYFEYFIDLYDKMYQTKNKLQILEDGIKEAETKGMTFTEYCYYIKDQLTKAIKSTEEYQQFLKLNLNNSMVVPQNINIYEPTIDDNYKYYISVDIIKANYNSLRYINSKIVLNTTSWEQLIKMFTNAKYFTEAKYFRQIVFGELNSKRISAIQKNIICKLYLAIKESKSNLKILGRHSDDELIISTDKQSIGLDYKTIKNIIDKLPEEIRDIFKIQAFRVHTLHPTSFVVKEIIKDINIDLDDIDNYVIKFKNICKDIFAQVYKYYYKLPLNDMDLTISINDNLASFREPLFI